LSRYIYKPVFNAECVSKYVSNIGDVRDHLCAQARAANIRTLMRPPHLEGSFRYSCGRTRPGESEHGMPRIASAPSPCQRRTAPYCQASCIAAAVRT